MANKPLKSIKFPGLSDTYTVPQIDNTLATAGKAADAKAAGDVVKVSSTQPTEATNKLWVKDQPGNEYTVPLYSEFEELKSAFAQRRRSGITYLRGGYYASGLKAEASNDSVSTGMINGGAVVTITGTYYRILLYNNGQYIGKISSSYGVDTVAGSWCNFTGTTDLYKLLAEKQADAFALVILANGTDAPTESTYQAWGESHCTMYTGMMYGIGDTKTRLEQLGSAFALQKKALYDSEVIYSTWIQGVHGGGSAEYVYNSGRCTTEDTFVLQEGEMITVRNVDSGLYFAIAGAKDGTTLYDSGWQTSTLSYTVPSSADGATFWVNTKNASETLTPSGIDTMEVAIQVLHRPYMTAGLLYESDDIDTLTDIGFYRVFSNHRPDNWPITGGGNFIVMRGTGIYNNDNVGICQMLCTSDEILTRFGASGTSWTDWSEFYAEGASPDVASLESTVSGLSENAYQKKAELTESDDIDTILSFGFYRVFSNHLPLNWPSTGGGNMLVMHASNTTDSLGRCQVIWMATKMLVRFGISGTTWTDWVYYNCDANSSEDIIGINNEEETLMKLRQLSTHRSLSTTLETQPLVLLHFSDLHSNDRALNRIINFRDYYSAYIDDTLHTGDNVASNYSESFIFGSVSGSENILNVIGNHDTWNPSASGTDYDQWHFASESESYTKYFEPFVSNWSATTISGKCYYYKDYPNKNVMLIVLDCMHETTDQLNWFISTLNTAKTNGRHVVIASHVIMGDVRNMTYLDSGFDNPLYPRTIEHSYGFPMYAASGFIDAVDSFVSGGGVVAVWLAGHMHNDTLATYHDVLNIAVTTAGAYSSLGVTTDKRVRGTKSEDAFNVMGVDTVAGYLYLMRVGMNYNAAMKRVDTLCWDYINHRMIYTC